MPGLPRSTLSSAIRAQDGLTIIEVMIAMVILLVGLLGTLALVEGGLSSTSRTTAREQGTNLARDLVERSRQAEYKDVTLDDAPATLRSKLLANLPAADSVSALSGTGNRTFHVTRRNVDYTVKVFACSIDDPTDGAGQGNAKFCEAPPAPPPPGTPPPEPQPAPAINVLGIGVSAGGTLLGTVCNALGTNAALLSALTSVVSAVAPLSVCPAVPAGTIAFDSQPEDLRRVRVDVSWNRGGAGSVAQTTLLTNPSQS